MRSSEHVATRVANGTGFITLNRPRALNALSLDMLRAITHALRDWRHDPAVAAVVIRGSGEVAFCAGGDIRFFHDAARAGLAGGAALVDDFFSEEYALNHLVHCYPKPYIAVMDGVVMGGGMGVAQAGPQSRVRIVTERTKLAMPEVNIGLFPDVGASHFLSRTPGRIGLYLAVTGATIGAADALAAGLADHFVPVAQLTALHALLEATPGAQLPAAIAAFAAPFAGQAGASALAAARPAIDRHFGAAADGDDAYAAADAGASAVAIALASRSIGAVSAITASLAADDSEFARATLALLTTRSPLMMCVAHALQLRGAALDIADCLRMERTAVRHVFEHGEVIEGIRALVVDKDRAPRWSPATLAQVSADMVARFFAPVWPDYAHPLHDLD